MSIGSVVQVGANAIKGGAGAIRASGANIGDAINVGFAVHDYNYAREQGNSRGVSLGKAAASFVWGEAFYGSMAIASNAAVSKMGLSATAGAIVGTGMTLGVTVGIAGIQVANAMGQHATQQMGKAYGSNGYLGSGQFDMNQAGYTMRQRSLNAIRQNGLNTQSVLGNEARTYFRDSV